MMLKIGDRMVECDENMVIKATSNEIRNPDGRVDVEIHVPSLKIQSRQPVKEAIRGLGLLALLGTGVFFIRQLFI